MSRDLPVRQLTTATMQDTQLSMLDCDTDASPIPAAVVRRFRRSTTNSERRRSLRITPTAAAMENDEMHADAALSTADRQPLRAWISATNSAVKDQNVSFVVAIRTTYLPAFSLENALGLAIPDHSSDDVRPHLTLCLPGNVHRTVPLNKTC